MRQGERGSSLVEVLVLGLVLLTPVIWGLTVLASVHETALAATAAVREAGTEAGRATDTASAEAAIRGAVAQAFLDQGLDPSVAEISYSGTGSFLRGGVIDIEVAVPVSVMRAPFIGSASGPAVWVTARHSAQIDPYASR